MDLVLFLAITPSRLEVEVMVGHLSLAKLQTQLPSFISCPPLSLSLSLSLSLFKDWPKVSGYIAASCKG